MSGSLRSSASRDDCCSRLSAAQASSSAPQLRCMNNRGGRTKPRNDLGVEISEGPGEGVEAEQSVVVRLGVLAVLRFRRRRIRIEDSEWYGAHPSLGHVDAIARRVLACRGFLVYRGHWAMKALLSC